MAVKPQAEETITDLDDRTKDVDVTDISNDVDTQEVIRSANAATSSMSSTNVPTQQQALYQQDMQDRAQARRHAEEEHGQRMRHQSNLDAQTILASQNNAVHIANVNSQTIRHTDHTLIDLHDPKAQK
jgi:hypothetical protein